MKKTPRTTAKTAKAKTAKVPAFVARAERAFLRAAENVRAQNKLLNLPIIGWKNGKMVKTLA